MTNNEPLFSILMANYNNGQYITTAIESIFAQSYPNWEIIIVDDCSTDNSLEILRAFANEPRIKVYSNSNNLGCGATKRRAAELATGEIAGYVDPDDAIFPEALALMAETHRQHPEASLVYSTAYYCDEQLKPTKVIDWIGPIPPGKSNLQVSKIGHFTTFKMASYRQTDGIDPKLLRAVDQDLYYRLEEVGEVKFIHQPLYKYRIHGGGISTLSNIIKAKKWAFYAKKEAYLRRLRGHSVAPNISLWRLFWDYRHMQYKAIRFAVLHGKWREIIQPFQNLFTSTKKILNYPLPE